MSEAQTHDYTVREWGHDYGIGRVEDGGQRVSAHGWGRGIRIGDFLLLQNGGTGARYRVETIRYTLDPDDMWFADLVFARLGGDA